MDPRYELSAPGAVKITIEVSPAGTILPKQGLNPTGLFIDITSPFNGDTVTLNAADMSFTVSGTIKPASMANSPPMRAWLEDAAGNVYNGVFQGAAGNPWTFKFSGVPAGQWLTVNVTAKDNTATPKISLGNSISVLTANPPGCAPVPPESQKRAKK